MSNRPKNIIQKIKSKLSFYEVFSDITTPEKKYNNYKCPFCGKSGTFSILHDEYGRCFYDKCEWKGDVINLYQDYYHLDIKTALDQLDLEYDLNTDADELSREKVLAERGKYLKRIADIKFIRQFRVMMEVIGYSRNYISSVLGGGRKYISLILNEKIDHEDLSEKRYNVLFNLMVKFYEENQDEMMHKMDLYFSDDTVALIRKVNQYINDMYY